MNVRHHHPSASFATLRQRISARRVCYGPIVYFSDVVAMPFSATEIWAVSLPPARVGFSSSVQSPMQHILLSFPSFLGTVHQFFSCPIRNGTRLINLTAEIKRTEGGYV
jgi:hypothetical protein